MRSSEIENRAKFDIIRYAQCWEDADILIEALDIRPGDVCLSIASAGDNALALLTKNPARVIALDLSPAQLECVALRVAAYKHLTHDELLQFMGSRPSNDRKALFRKCLPSLPSATVAFWETRLDDVQKHGLAGVGKFENYFRLFRTYVHPLAHSRRTVEDLLRPKSPEAREKFYRHQWDTWRWRLLLKLFFSRQAMGQHGRDPAFFDYVEDSVSTHVDRRTRHALTALDPSENPYLHWILTGTHGQALPCALRQENFDIIRDNINRLEWRLQSVEEFAATQEKIDAFNLSDIFEYMSDAAYKALYTRLIDAARPGARIAYWNMMVPRALPDTLDSQVISHSAQAKDLFIRDKAFFYSRFLIEEVK
jgi:S-adenosylmethionine-diacylglycerol 3-amino-3-carboxypropyl transferase